MVTLNEIAKRAGVAKSTVSRFLNNGPVSDETREKIQKIIDETGYVPNQFAQSLKAQRSNMIGVILPRFDSPSTNQVLRGIDELAYEQGYQLVLTNSNLDSQREKENLALLERQKVSGIIWIASLFDETLVQQIKQLKVPILVIGQQIEGVPCLVHQDYQAGVKIAEHALSLGHRDLLYVGVTEDDNAVGVLRRDGFVETVHQAGATVSLLETDFSRKLAYEQALTYLPDVKATYIAAATDQIAIGIANAAQDLKLKIPEDFSLSGFGGYSESDYAYPRITTVDYPFYELGKKALELLKKLIVTGSIPLLQTMGNELHVKPSTRQLD
ncbi:LacI family DNA-binding transcriptional regulator [Fundicoccus sp. Sow4_F4]|uniref:LacI family DNA-binding transcriptional regulator n=1 Tax=Fundicoccus sp. Sow4_F4 TaxID=3438783 RepID=UPI003F8E5FA1